jgi:hypothetical protein
VILSRLVFRIQMVPFTGEPSRAPVAEVLDQMCVKVVRLVRSPQRAMLLLQPFLEFGPVLTGAIARWAHLTG